MATHPDKIAFANGVINHSNQLAVISGSNQGGQVMYTSIQYRSVHTDSGAVKKMKLTMPQKIGTQKPTIAQNTNRRIMAKQLHCSFDAWQIIDPPTNDCNVGAILVCRIAAFGRLPTN
jgi:hypothetical protein